ncbi:MAG: hypothetical protein CMF48_01815 [Legionellales bacterium]|nr:hypothetical protein [Legionellales bacterium]
MQYKMAKAITALLLMAFSFTAGALNIPDLFEVTAVNIEPKSKEAFFSDSLEQVLIRLTGKPGVGHTKQAQSLLLNAERFVQKYRLADSAWWVQFDEAKIIDQLESTNVTYLSTNRPLALAWIAIEDHQGHRRVVDASNGEFLSLIANQNEAFAMSVTLPLMDLEDVGQVSVTDIHPNFAPRISAASTRYGADVWLAAKVEERLPSQWTMEWMIQTPTRTRVFKPMKSDSSEALLLEAFEALAPIIVEDYGITNTRSLKQFTVQVEEVKSLAQYSHLMKYLRDLDVVNHVKLDSFEGNTLTLSLEALGGEAALAQSVRLDHQLIARGDRQFIWSP